LAQTAHATLDIGAFILRAKISAFLRGILLKYSAVRIMPRHVVKFTFEESAIFLLKIDMFQVNIEHSGN
jgi:hypothetical protein